VHLASFASISAITWCPVHDALSTLHCCWLQLGNPLYLWQLWDHEVRQQRRCLARHNQMVTDKVQQLRRHPPAPHTIAGKCSPCSSVALVLILQLQSALVRRCPGEWSRLEASHGAGAGVCGMRFYLS
jgi:hypothetical protein